MCLEKWYGCPYFRSRNTDADIQNGYVDTVWEEEGGMMWEIRTDIYALPYVKQIDSGKLL